MRMFGFVAAGVAALLTATVLAAAPAGAASGPRAGAGRSSGAPSMAQIGPARGGHRAPGGLAAASQQCFYVFPDCTSTNPTAAFTVVSIGDTSSCTFQYTTDWGDGNIDTQSFPGGPDGSILATFSHLYDITQPQTWTITVTGTVTSGSCGSTSGTLMFTLLPQLGVGAVRFAPLASPYPNTTPGLPVIKDDGPSLTMDNQFGPASCDGITSPPDYDYLDCGTPVPSGSPVKIWPVIYAGGGALTLDQVVFVANGQVPNPQVTATATLSGSATASFTLPATPLSQAQAGSSYLLTGSSLTFTGALPAVPGRDTLTITWTVTDVNSGVQVQTVTSSHVIYVTAGTYASPSGVLGEDQQPFVTVLDAGTAAASGVSGTQNVFDAIWQKFTTLTINQAILDPATGQVSNGNVLTYYNNGFTTLSDGFNGNRLGCTDVPGMLATDSGHCGAWADFFAMVMAFQGIPAQATGLGGATGFNPGPAPGGGCDAINCAYMLVGPKLWHFHHGTAGGTYPYRDQLTVTPAGQIAITGSQVTYSSTSPIAQGQVSTPPMWFIDGDHAIDQVTLPSGQVWVDPSYGDPMKGKLFGTVSAYEPSALAGFAVIYQQVGTTLQPLPATYSESQIATACANATCYFQASKGS